MSRKKIINRLPLIAILAVFIVPMVSAWILFHYHGFFHIKSVNHGILLSPMEKTTADALHQWQIVYVSQGDCDSNCAMDVHQLHQMVMLLGKNQRRVTVVQRKVLLDLPRNRVYLIDPHGNIFMYYSDPIDPMAVYKDLKRLLDVSQVG